MKYLILIFALVGCSSNSKESEQDPESRMGPALPAVEVEPVMPVGNG